ncbi:MAG: alkaline phosphatase family protein, partial [Solirubrobacteraceae bacterium]
KIKHVVVIMQENRSFDQYFGTFRGVTGIPGLASNPGRPPCIPDPQNMYGRCDGPVAGDPAGVPGHRSAAEAGMLRAS